MNSLPSARGSASFALAFALVSSSSLLGCELVAGLQKRQLSTIGDGGSSDPGTNQSLASCTIEGTSTGSVRFANLVPNGDALDVCMKPATAASFDGVKPYFGSVGPACAGGMKYKDVTMSLPIAAGQYELKMIRAGGKCDGAAVATLGTALIEEQRPTDFFVLDGGGGAATVRRFVESRPDRPSQAKLTLVNAVSDLGAVDFGVSADKKFESGIVATYFKKVVFGEAPTVSPGLAAAVDANGYVSQQSGAGSFSYKVSSSEGAVVLTSTSRKIDAGASFAFLVVGTKEVPDYPLETFACDLVKGTGALASCSDAQSVDVTVDNVNVQLSGPFAGAEQARRDFAIETVAKLSSDVVCVTEAYKDADKDAIIAAAKATFPYHYYEKTNDDTPINDPTDWDGTIPAEPPPACKASVTKMDALASCLRDKCATVKDESGIAVQDPSTCMSQEGAAGCTQEILNMLGGTSNDIACWGCVFAQFNSYEPISSIRTRCASAPRAKGFRGQNGVVMLSRLPLSEQAWYALPYVGAWTPGVAKAKVTAQNGAAFDFYCAAPGGTADDCVLFPMTSGPYTRGPENVAPADCIAASSNQQKIHIKKMKEWFDATSGKSRTPMIVSGDFYTGPSFRNGLLGVNEANFNYLADKYFSLGVPSGYEPACTRCRDNPLAGTGANDWTRFNFLRFIAVTNVRSTSVFLKEASVQTVYNGSPASLPIGVYYGLRSVISLAP